MGFWLQLGVAGFRMDAVPFIIERVDPETGAESPDYELLRHFREFAQWRMGETVILAEANVAPEETIRFFGEDGDRLQMMFNFTVNQWLFYVLASGEAQPLAKAMQETRERPEVARERDRPVGIELLAAVDDDGEKPCAAPEIAGDAAVDQRQERVVARVLLTPHAALRAKDHRLAVAAQSQVIGEAEEVAAHHRVVQLYRPVTFDDHPLAKDLRRQVLHRRCLPLFVLPAARVTDRGVEGNGGGRVAGGGTTIPLEAFKRGISAESD
jgi:hypothetical protein